MTRPDPTQSETCDRSQIYLHDVPNYLLVQLTVIQNYIFTELRQKCNAFYKLQNGPKMRPKHTFACIFQMS